MKHKFDDADGLRILTARDLQSILNIGKNQAYALMHSNAFPTIQINHRLFVTEDALREWTQLYRGRRFKYSI